MVHGHTGLLTACEQDQNGSFLILLVSRQETFVCLFVYSPFSRLTRLLARFIEFSRL